MPEPADDDRIPEAVPPLPLPEFSYDDLERGERIGTGGDADVYRATIDHDGYTYPVAIKEPRFEGTIQQRVVEKFETEAETWSSLNDHDNIVSVYTWGTEPLPWLALEFMDGGTLEPRIGSADIAEALWLSGRIAEGIRYGHRHGVAHLDIKPSNVLLRDTPAGKWDYPKVSDWGLAKMLLQHSNSIEGISPTYAAPEQFDAEKYGNPDDITDIYQLGVLVYALVAGEPPFTGSSTAVMQGVLQDEPDPPSAVNSAVPEAIDEVVWKALAKEKSDRYDGVLTFRKELDRLFEEYTAGDAKTVATGVVSSDSGSTDQTNEKPTVTSDEKAVANETGTGHAERQSQLSSPAKQSQSPPSQSSKQRRSEDSTSRISRRVVLGLLGVGVLGGSGWMITQQGGDNDSSPPASIPTETQTETPLNTRSVGPTSTETQTETETQITTSTETPAETENTTSTVTSTETNTNSIQEINADLNATGGLAFQDGSIFFESEGDIREFDIQKDEIVNSFSHPEDVSPSGLAYGADSLWFSDLEQPSYSGKIAEYEPTSGERRSLISLSWDPVGLAFGEGSLWVTDITTNQIVEFSPEGERLNSFDYRGPTGSTWGEGLAYFDGSLWLGIDCDERGCTVSLFEFDTSGNLIQQTGTRRSDNGPGYSGLASTESHLLGPNKEGNVIILRSLE